MKFLRPLYLSAVMLLAVGGPATAMHRGAAPGQAIEPSSAPVLQNTVVSFGQITPNGRGAVQLSSMSQTIPSYVPTTVAGLDLMSPNAPPCLAWTVTYQGNTAGRPGTDFTIPAASTQEGTSAVTPVIASSGAGHITGTYTWNVQCAGVDGQVSNIATLQYVTVANMANVGQNDRIDFGTMPSGFGNSADQILAISTGVDWHTTRRIFALSQFTNKVTIRPADTGKTPYWSNMAWSNGSNYEVKDFTLTGDTDISGVNVIMQATTTGSNVNHDITFNNINYRGSYWFVPRSSNNSGQGSFGISNCSGNCLIKDSSASWVIGGFVNNANTVFDNVYISYFTNNCVFLSSTGPGGNSTFRNFTTCASPAIIANGNHVDVMQVADGSSVDNVLVQNFWAYQGAGTDESQGPIFGGGPLQLKGYVAPSGDGTQAIMTLTTGSAANGSGKMHVQVPGYITPEDEIYWQSASGGQTVFTLVDNTGAPIAARTIGSAGSPVDIYSVTPYNFNMDGIVSTNSTYRGWTPSGFTGQSSIKHFGYVQQDANPPQMTTYQATLDSDTQMTVTSVPTTNRPNEVEPFIHGGGRLKYDATAQGGTVCNFCGPGVGAQLTSTEDVQAVGVGGISGRTLTITELTSGNFAYNLTNGSHAGGLMLTGTGVPDGVYIQQGVSGTGGTGTYTICLQTTVGCSGTVSVPAGTVLTGRPVNKRGTYQISPAPAHPLPTGAITVTNTGGYPVGRTSGASMYDQNCSVLAFHGGTFVMDRGYAQNGQPTLCSTNSTKTNTVVPVAADYQTGILPYDSLTAITAPTWDAMTPTQQRAMICTKMLPKVGGALDLGSDDWIGPFTATGELITEDGLVPIVGCGVH